jgi:uncharacterized protein YdhG (YjbR/CyaY superfamily)
MKSESLTVEDYIQNLPEDRRTVIDKLRKIIKKNLPEGFSEEINYGMIGYVVPLSVYPRGYLDKKDQPLPFINIASQKNYIALYHMGIYADPELLKWFKVEYAATCSSKLDMGKSCIRFKKLEDIPFKLIGQLASKISVKRWIEMYESGRGNSGR